MINYWTLIGLIFDLLGVVLVFIWGPPTKPLYKDTAAVTFKSPETTREAQEEWARQQRLSRIGLAIIGVGFMLQIIGTLPFASG